MSKLLRYNVRKGTTQNSKGTYDWTIFEFIFQDLSGKEYKIVALPKNGDMVARLLGFTDEEIITETEVRVKK